MAVLEGMHDIGKLRGFVKRHTCARYQGCSQPSKTEGKVGHCGQHMGNNNLLHVFKRNRGASIHSKTITGRQFKQIQNKTDSENCHS